MSPTKMSKIEAAIRTVIDMNTAFNQHAVDGMMKVMDPDCVLETAGPAPDGTRYTGKEAITAHWLAFFQQHPNAYIEIEEIFSVWDRCVMRWKFWPDKGQEASYARGIDVFRVRDGQIREVLTYRKA